MLGEERGPMPQRVVAGDLARHYLGGEHPAFATALDNLGLLHKIVGNYIDTGHYCYKRWSSAPTRQQSMQPRCACRGAWRCAPRGAVLARANCSGGTGKNHACTVFATYCDAWLLSSHAAMGGKPCLRLDNYPDQAQFRVVAQHIVRDTFFPPSDAHH